MAYYVSSGQVSSGIILNNDSMFVYGGGTADRTTVNSRGRLAVYSGGTATNIVENGGWVSVPYGADVTFTPNVISGLVLTLPVDKATLHSGTTANSTAVNGGGNLVVSSGGTANSTILNSGRLEVRSGGMANNTTVNSYGNMFVTRGGTANSTTVFGGSMYVSIGGMANSTTVFGGSPYDVTPSSGWLYVSSGGTANDTMVNSRGLLCVSSGGTANNTTVNSSGVLDVSSGGTANSITVNGGSIGVLSGGTATNIVENGGYVYVAGEATVTFTPNIISGLVFSDASATLHSGTTANSTTVNSSGRLFVYNGGVALNTIVNSGGSLFVSSGGIVTGKLDITAGAFVSAYSGSIIDFNISGQTAGSSALVNDFSLIQGSPDYTITVSADQAFGCYTLAAGMYGFAGTVSIGTAETSYGAVTVNWGNLVYGDYAFTLTTSENDLVLTIEHDPGEAGLTIVGEFATKHYGDKLTVYSHGSFNLESLQSHDDTFIGRLDPDRWEVLGSFDFTGDGLLNLAIKDKTTGNVYVGSNLVNGISEEKLLNGTCLGMLGEGYSIYGAGQFDGKSRDNDILLKGPAFGDPSVSLNYGLPVWVFNGSVKQYDGWLGALVNTWQPGKVLSGDTSDLADINAKNYQYDVVAIGDFNGDGRTDVMLQNTMPDQVDETAITGAGDIFTFLTGDETAVKTGAGPTVCYAGKVDAINLNGWGIAGTGDFNNDGIDDVLLQDQASGGIACWIMNHGQMQNSEWIGTKASGDEIAGIWDVNGDGTDDVVLSTDSGYEAWIIQNGQYSTKQLLA